MAKKKISRKELLKSPDEFLTLSERALEFVSSHKKELKIIGVAAVAGALIYLGMNTYMNFVNKKGQEALNIASLSFSKIDIARPDTGKLKETEELYRKVVNEHGFSRAAELALPQIGYIKFLSREYDEAVEFYKEFLDDVSGEPQYESLARLATSACYEAKGDFKNAIEILNPALEYSDEVFGETAMINLARLYRLDNNPDKSRSVLMDFVKKYENSPYIPLVKSQI